MSVYTDGTHLVADTRSELHAFARRLGLRRLWFQDSPRHPHYDLTSEHMMRKALMAGAAPRTSREIAEIEVGEA